MPELHVIAAGSLLDFAIEQVGVPVGRVSTLYMYPLSFIEFLVAIQHKKWAHAIINTEIPVSEPLHEKILELVGIYLAIGGMPEAVNNWIKTKSSREVKSVHADLIYSYEQDFGKYARKHQIKYLNLIFLKAIEQLSRKFIYAHVGAYQKRELEPALELLEKAGLLYKVIKSSGQGIPIGAHADISDFKILFLDVGLSQALLKLDISSWIIDPLTTFVNKGELVEAFIGQELLAYSNPIRKDQLYYWRRDTRASEAEIDYIIQEKEFVIPIEVKAGGNRRIKSMHLFQKSHPQSPYGLRFWASPEEIDKKIRSYPLYAVAKTLITNHEPMRKALVKLVS